MGELVAGLTPDDLRQLTNEMVDAMQALIAECVDADVTFVPGDPQAYDGNTANPEDVYLAWTLGHVLCHATGTSDQDAANAAAPGVARGHAFPNEPRNEVPWETVTTIAHCRHRLAMLDRWPADWATSPAIDSEARLRTLKRFAHGLSHDDTHRPHLAEIVKQAKAARGGAQ